MIARIWRLLRNLRVLPFCVSLAFGATTTWFAINVSNGTAVVILDQTEAEGPRFADPNQLDIFTKLRRNRVCPAITQRWVWRWIDYEGQKTQQIIPLLGTSLPFLADGQAIILTIPNPGVPNLNDHWYFRSVTEEQCAWLPAFVSGWFGTHVFRSADLPVNFIGEPHEVTPK